MSGSISYWDLRVRLRLGDVRCPVPLHRRHRYMLQHQRSTRQYLICLGQVTLSKSSPNQNMARSSWQRRYCQSRFERSAVHLGFIGLSLPLKVMPFSLAFGLWPRFDLWKVWYCLQALFEVSCAKEATDAFQLKNLTKAPLWRCRGSVLIA